MRAEHARSRTSSPAEEVPRSTDHISIGAGNDLDNDSSDDISIPGSMPGLLDVSDAESCTEHGPDSALVQFMQGAVSGTRWYAVFLRD